MERHLSEPCSATFNQVPRLACRNELKPFCNNNSNSGAYGTRRFNAVRSRIKNDWGYNGQLVAAEICGVKFLVNYF